MNIGFIGLGRMGFNMVQNLLDHNHKIIATDLNTKAVKKISRKGAKGAGSLKEMVESLPSRKIVWLMIPAGKPVDDILRELVPMLKKGDAIIDGGNSYFKDSIRRSKELKRDGISFLDCGTSGGVSGARHGACMMIGGDKKVFKKMEVLFKDLCVKDGYGYMGRSGAGHFVKMVHNGIEYGMMGAIAEGVQAVKNSDFNSDIQKVVKVYAHGSIIESRLMSWLHDSFQKKGYLASISGEVPQGETEEEMKKLEKIADMKVLSEARKMREETRKRRSFAGKLIAAMRNQFGGHAVKKRKF